MCSAQVQYTCEGVYSVYCIVFCDIIQTCSWITNKDQSNLAKGGITRLYLPGGSIGLTVWLQFAISCFGCGVWPSNLPFLWGSGTPFNTKCRWTPQVYLPSGIWICRTVWAWGTNVTDRQTDHATDKSVGIRGMACAAREISAKTSCITFILDSCRSQYWRSTWFTFLWFTLPLPNEWPCSSCLYAAVVSLVPV